MSGRRPAVFLDRDGTVLVERNYLADPDDVELIAGTTDALRRLRHAGFALVIVTNQSGIARGLYGEAEYRLVDERMRELLRDGGVELDASYHCPHHPAHSGPCDCRKPAPGLFLRAADELSLDPSRSWLIGDRMRDLKPASGLGARAILVRTGYGAEEAAGAAAAGVEVVENVGAAAALVLARAAGSNA